MSSPSRMLRGRPTAPLPTQYASNSLSSLHKDEYCEEDVIAEQTSPTFSGKPKTSSTYSPAQRCCTSVDLDLELFCSEDSIRDYLRFHKTFLEEFILEDVPQETLERILIRKAQRKNSATDLQKTLEYEIPKALSRWKFCVHSDKQELIHSLTRSIHDGVPFNSILLQLSKSIADAVKANISELLLVESDALVPATDDSDKADAVSVDIRIGCTVEGFVAATKQVMKINILDERLNANFPEGTRLTQKDSAVASVLCVPILQGDDSLLGVLAMGRKAAEPQFASEDEEIIKSYLSWAAVALYSAQEHLTCLQQRKLNDTYKLMTKFMLESQSDCKTILQTINDTITNTINADRAAMFLMDSEGKNLYAQVFTVSKEEEHLVTLDHLESKYFEDYLNQLGQKINVVRYNGSNVKISIDKGVAGYTARTGKLQNVTDAKICPHFCVEVDELTGYTTHTLLCAPLVAQGRVLGVLEAVNKKDGGVFTEADEKSLQALAEFCSLLVSNCQMKENLSSVENRLKVSHEILAYHRPCSEDHFQWVKEMTLSKEEEQLVQNMSIDTAALSLDKKVRLVLTMFTDLVDVSSFQFDLNQCLRFALTVAKNYRNEEYHNWDHAFSVAHCMYWIIKGAPAERFSELERISLFWGCLCHDLDHRGHNNTFLVKTGAPLAKLYSSSILENHHFSQALALLRLEGHDIFSCLSPEQYKTVLTIMQKAILATDLVLFFNNKDRFSKIINSGEFSWDVPQHKELVISLMMTASDLCSSCKPWEKHRHGVTALFEEFHNQGDKETALGLTPLEMMDRNFKHKLPSCQVGFLRSIACPCCELLLTALPHVEKLLHSAQNNMEMWEKISKETTTD